MRRTPSTITLLGGGKAVRYGIGVGREAIYMKSGTQSASRKAEWPYPDSAPQEMIARQPRPAALGGSGQLPSARARFISGYTRYRIHGTNAPDTIGKKVSSGCIRMLNADVIDLFSRIDVGTTVVLPARGYQAAPVAARRS